MGADGARGAARIAATFWILTTDKVGKQAGNAACAFGLELDRCCCRRLHCSTSGASKVEDVTDADATRPVGWLRATQMRHPDPRLSGE